MFLRELGYHHGKLVEKIPLMLMKEQFGPLLQTSKICSSKTLMLNPQLLEKLVVILSTMEKLAVSQNE